MVPLSRTSKIVEEILKEAGIPTLNDVKRELEKYKSEISVREGTNPSGDKNLTVKSKTNGKEWFFLQTRDSGELIYGDDSVTLNLDTKEDLPKAVDEMMEEFRQD
jgi:hypothetical protein